MVQLGEVEDIARGEAGEEEGDYDQQHTHYLVG